jgi:hypothetical protein
MFYKTERKSKKTSKEVDVSDDSRDTYTLKKKSFPSNLKDIHKANSQTSTDLDEFRENFVAEVVNTSDISTKLVQVYDIILLQKDLQCLTQEGEKLEDNWLDGEVRAFAKRSCLVLFFCTI